VAERVIAGSAVTSSRTSGITCRGRGRRRFAWRRQRRSGPPTPIGAMRGRTSPGSVVFHRLLHAPTGARTCSGTPGRRHGIGCAPTCCPGCTSHVRPWGRYSTTSCARTSIASSLRRRPPPTVPACHASSSVSSVASSGVGCSSGALPASGATAVGSSGRAPRRKPRPPSRRVTSPTLALDEQHRERRAVPLRERATFGASTGAVVVCATVRTGRRPVPRLRHNLGSRRVALRVSSSLRPQR
jgi:hypothetical protein